MPPKRFRRLARPSTTSRNCNLESSCAESTRNLDLRLTEMARPYKWRPRAQELVANGQGQGFIPASMDQELQRCSGNEAPIAALISRRAQAGILVLSDPLQAA